MQGAHLGVSQASSSSGMSAPTQIQTAKPSRRRIPKTCGECRRLKLKCDRVFPCQSCIKRGCEGICPEGSLVSGRGSRYILANTEQLHEKIVRMAERIRDLEDALRAVSQEHAHCLNLDLSPSGPAHPLLRDDLLLIKNQLELYGSDRSQLASRSESSYTSDGSDGEHSRLENEQSLSPSPLDALLLNSSSPYLEAQLAQLAANDNLDPTSQLLSNIQMTDRLWSPSHQDSNQYQNEARPTNSNGAPHFPYTVNTMPAGNHQSRNYQASDSSLPLHNMMQANATYSSDAGRYLLPDLFLQSQNRADNQFNNMWNGI